MAMMNDDQVLGWATVAETPEYGLLFLADEIDRPKKEKAFDTFTRYSAAGGCARQTALEALDVDESDPNDFATLLNFRMGTLIHDEIQRNAEAKFREDPRTTALEMEKPTRHDDLTSGSGDILHGLELDDGSKVLRAIELKSMGGFGFKAMIGAIGGADPEGPKTQHVKQAALTAEAVGADEVRVSVIAKEAVSPGQMKRFSLDDLFTNRFPAVEYVFGRDQYAPIAEAELTRIQRLKAVVDGGEVPMATVPDLPAGAVVEAARFGTWNVRDADNDVVQTGNFWGCDYCNHQRTCHALGPGRVEIGRIGEAREEGMAVEAGVTRTALKAIKMGTI